MNIKELINQLSKYPQDLKVFIGEDSWHGAHEVNELIEVTVDNKGEGVYLL